MPGRFDDMPDDIPWLMREQEMQGKEKVVLLRSSFKRGARFIVSGGENLGKLIEYVRRRKHTNFVVFTDVSKGGELNFHLSSLPPMTKGARKKTNAQGSYQILAMCDGCSLRIRASASTFRRGTATCFDDTCSRRGQPLHIEWEK